MGPVPSESRDSKRSNKLYPLNKHGWPETCHVQQGSSVYVVPPWRETNNLIGFGMSKDHYGSDKRSHSSLDPKHKQLCFKKKVYTIHTHTRYLKNTTKMGSVILKNIYQRSKIYKYICTPCIKESCIFCRHRHQGTSTLPSHNFRRHFCSTPSCCPVGSWSGTTVCFKNNPIG